MRRNELVGNPLLLQLRRRILFVGACLLVPHAVPRLL
jgi:hypothetical protein